MLTVRIYDHVHQQCRRIRRQALQLYLHLSLPHHVYIWIKALHESLYFFRYEVFANINGTDMVNNSICRSFARTNKLCFQHFFMKRSTSLSFVIIWYLGGALLAWAMCQFGSGFVSNEKADIFACCSVSLSLNTSVYL